MRLRGWLAKTPSQEAASPRVVAALGSALEMLGAEADPECWVAWGDDPSVRYMLFVPTPAGLVHLTVRVAVPGEGPRAGGKIIRWSRVQLGELAVEIQGGHRLVTFQVENQVLNGADATADPIAAFAQSLFAAADGRSPVVAAATKSPPAKAASSAKGATAGKAIQRLPNPKASTR